MKLCNRCQTMKPLESFSRHSGNPDGLQTLCKTCQRTKPSTCEECGQDFMAQPQAPAKYCSNSCRARAVNRRRSPRRRQMQDVIDQLEKMADLCERLAQLTEAEEQSRAKVRKNLIGQDHDPDMELPNLLYQESRNCRAAIDRIREEV